MHLYIDSIFFDSCKFYSPSAFLNFQNTNSIYTRNIYPGTEDLAKSSDFFITNSEFSNTIALSVGTTILNVEFTNCTFDSSDYFIVNDVSGLSVDSLYVKSEDNTFTNDFDPFYIRANSKKVVLESINDNYSNASFTLITNPPGSMRVIDNKTLPFSTLANLSPLTGDICTDLIDTYEWDGDSWEIYVP